MIDLRIYRVALVPALAAFVVMMFSLSSPPDAKRSRLAPNGLDGDRAAATASELARLAPDRQPGSTGDERLAALVRQRFSAIQGGQVTEQTFDGEFQGDGVEMRNVVLTLPGQSDRRVALIAHRDEAEGPGLASSAAATATLMEIASSFSGSTHRKTLVFVSTDGGSAAADGARRFAEDYPGNEELDAIVSLEQPGAASPRPPFVVPWSADRRSTSMQLTASAQAAVRDEVGRPTGEMGVFGQLVQLAQPSGLGEQSVAIAAGFDSVSISSAGERPLPPGETGIVSFSGDSVGEFGRATLSLMLALDASTEPLEHGPRAYVRVAENLLPGWTVSLLALALILPIAAAAIDGLARLSRRGRPTLRPVSWVVQRSLPLVAGLLVLYVMAVLTVIPAPDFPFDSRTYDIGIPAVLGLVLSAAAIVAVGYLSQPLRPPPGAGAESIAVASAGVMSGTMLVLWLLNPYLALLFVPALHLWQLPGLPRLRSGLTLSIAVVAAGLVVPLLALVQLADRLQLGKGIVWGEILMVTGGHIGAAEALLICLMGGCAVATIAVGAARRAEGPRDERRQPELKRSNPFGLEPIE